MERRRLGRLGILGGTFDPIHLGHLLLAETARQQLQLDMVLIEPVGQPPHKESADITPLRHRLAMLELACAGNSYLLVNCTDCHRPPPHYTATLLPIIQQSHPAAQLWLLLGSDSLHDLPTWHQPGDIVAACRLAVLPRPGIDIDWQRLEAALPGSRAQVDWLDGPTFTMSSTDIRRWLGEGRDLRYLLPTAVNDYIAHESLYKSIYRKV